VYPKRDYRGKITFYMADSHHHQLVKTVAGALAQRCQVAESQHLLVAVSGGADSVALLRALAGLAPRRKWRLRLTVAHIDHALRHTSSDDSDFVEQLAGSLGLPFVLRHLDLSEAHENLEAAARIARYAALRKIADEAGCDWIATAHHSDDQLETLLMRLLRGTSVTGLTGIAAVCGRVIRPMLQVDRAQVLDFLGALGQRWCEDATNADTSLVRNRLRHEVLPVLRDLRGDVSAKAVRLADHARVLDDWIEQLVAQHTPPHGDLDRAKARAMNQLLLTGVLRRMLKRAGVGSDHLGQAMLDSLGRAVRDREGGQRTFTLADGVIVTVQRDVVTVQRPKSIP